MQSVLDGIASRLQKKEKVKVITGIRKITKEIERSENGICIITKNYYPEDAFSHLPELCRSTGNEFYNEFNYNEVNELFNSEPKKHSSYFIKMI